MGALPVIGYNARTKKRRPPPETAMLDELLSFQCICREKSIRKAAQLLFITPQGLSKALRNLERELGVKLFIRTSEGMTLTEYGEVVESYADKALADLGAMRRNLADLHASIQSRIRVAMSYGIVSACCPNS